MLSDASCFSHIYLLTGYADMHKGIDGLIAIVAGAFNLDPTENGSVFLFCGKRTDRMKAAVIALYTQMSESLETLSKQNEYIQKQNEKLSNQIDDLTEKLTILTMQRFGKKTETAGQLSFDLENQCILNETRKSI